MTKADPVNDTAAIELGQKPERRGWRARFTGRRSYLVVLGALFSFVLLVCAFVTAMDPYNLYGWGPKAKLVRDHYENSPGPWVLNIVTAEDYDTLMVGGSTALNFLPSDMQKFLAGTKHAFNLAYAAPRPRDLQIVMSKVESAKGLRRVLLMLDVTFLLPEEENRLQFPDFLYDRDPTNDLRAADTRSLQLSLHLLTGTEFVVSDWDASRRQTGQVARYQLTERTEYLNKARSIIARRKADVAAPTALTCSDLPAVGMIHDFARDLNARGVRLDIVVPAYSYYLYYDWFNPIAMTVTRQNPPFATLILLRRCALLATSEFRNAHFHAVDLERKITEDMANYYDSAHFYGTDATAQILKIIDAGRDEVNLGSFDAYVTELRRRVAKYEYYDSRLQGPRDD